MGCTDRVEREVGIGEASQMTPYLIRRDPANGYASTARVLARVEALWQAKCYFPLILGNRY